MGQYQPSVGKTPGGGFASPFSAKNPPPTGITGPSAAQPQQPQSQGTPYNPQQGQPFGAWAPQQQATPQPQTPATATGLPFQPMGQIGNQPPPPPAVREWMNSLTPGHWQLQPWHGPPASESPPPPSSAQPSPPPPERPRHPVSPAEARAHEQRARHISDRYPMFDDERNMFWQLVQGGVKPDHAYNHVRKLRDAPA
jgi:hypothetical protein